MDGDSAAFVNNYKEKEAKVALKPAIYENK